MDNPTPPAEELRLIDGELARLDARRAQLLARRAWLLQALHPATGTRAWPVRTPQPTADASSPSAQTVLLALGGILLAVAAVAFTVVSWGHLGIGGRALVLGAVTTTVLAAPARLLRRGLGATAESVAAVGLVLTVLDAYAVHRAVLPDTRAAGYAACACAVLAALWAGYGTALGRLRAPLPAAVVAAQLPLPLWALTVGAGPLTTGWSMLATAALDVAVVFLAKPTAVRGVALAGAVTTGGWAVLSGLWPSVTAVSAEGAAGPGALLLAASGLGLCAAWRAPESAPATAAAAGLAAVAGVGGVIRPLLPGGWAVLGYLACGIALVVALRTSAPRGVRIGLGIASGVAQGAAVLWAAPGVVLAVVRPPAGGGGIWAGRPELTAVWPGSTTAPVVLAAVAAALWATARYAADRALPRVPMVCGALALLWCAVVTAPAALSLSFPATTAVVLAAAVAGLAAATRPSLGARRAGSTVGGPAVTARAVDGRKTARQADATRGPLPPRATDGGPDPIAVTALVCGIAGGLGAVLLGLATRPATFTVLGVLVAAFTAAAVTARGVLRTVLGCSSVVVTAGLVASTAAAAGLSAPRIGLVLLAVPAGTALLGARLGDRPVALPVELTGAASAVVSVALTVPHPPSLALVLALAGVVAAGTAVRAERRPAAGWAATVLFVAAAWVRLAASGVSAPEAYTIPVTVPALAVGVLRRRRDPGASSWTAYGPGLATTLLPGLVAAWGDVSWPRPLALGLAALALTLTGARRRLQAPLLLGGLVLALDALHELAPYVVQAVGALPRWLPPALAGLLLLAAGATYEQRLSDARRVRRALNRMR
ncbi:SCO7613 C-terminal domain-containing membrane protein [Streptomyces sp. NPDC059176]|uniref:SCO7613 C-terminal domain-containing membrane protein n=1 Tax=unclassified Streptomyces TaxID=2593676 RepID=UPI0036C898BF